MNNEELSIFYNNLKVERDALAVENVVLKDKIIALASELDHISYHEFNAPIDENTRVVNSMLTPVTSAALAAIEARGVNKLIERKLKQLANMHPDTHAFGATAMSLRAQINELQAFAIELREAK